jgi:hypothetical protein
VVLHTITGSEAATVGVPVVVDVEAGVVADVPDGELDVVESLGWVVPDDEPGPDDPHAATDSTRASPAPTAAALRRRSERGT